MNCQTNDMSAQGSGSSMPKTGASWGLEKCRLHGLRPEHILTCPLCRENLSLFLLAYRGTQVRESTIHRVDLHHLLLCIHCQSLAPLFFNDLSILSTYADDHHRRGCRFCQEMERRIEEGRGKEATDWPLEDDKNSVSGFPWSSPRRRWDRQANTPISPPDRKITQRVRNGKVTTEETYTYHMKSGASQNTTRKRRKWEPSDE
jgi:uncharacterized protein YbaR (Trm112 family)